MPLRMIDGLFLCWAQWPIHNIGLGLLTGFRSVDLEKNRGIKCPFAYLLDHKSMHALWCEPRKLVNIL